MSNKSNSNPPVPGSEDFLGFGANVFSTYNVDCKTYQIIDFTKQGYLPNPVKVGEQSYECPKGVSYSPENTLYSKTQTIENKTDLTSFFSAQAKISGTYGAFSGEASASASFKSEDMTYSKCAMCYVTAELYQLTAKASPNPSMFAADFLADQTAQKFLAAAKAGFSHSNAKDFFDFFDKYGTHFVNEIIVGGSLRYYAALNRSYSMTDDQVNASMSLEYNAVLAKAGAEAEADWSKSGKEWTQNRTAYVVCHGGDPTKLNIPNVPNTFTNYNDLFTTWQSTLASNVYYSDFNLKPISSLFASSQEAAINTALMLYAQEGINIESWNWGEVAGAGAQSKNYPTVATLASYNQTKNEVVVSDLIPDNMKFTPPTMHGDEAYPFKGFIVIDRDPSATTISPYQTFLNTANFGNIVTWDGTTVPDLSNLQKYLTDDYIVLLISGANMSDVYDDASATPNCITDELYSKLKTLCGEMPVLETEQKACNTRGDSKNNAISYICAFIPTTTNCIETLEIGDAPQAPELFKTTFHVPLVQIYNSTTQKYQYTIVDRSQSTKHPQQSKSSKTKKLESV